jgi:hypothetical protein
MVGWLPLKPTRQSRGRATTVRSGLIALWASDPSSEKTERDSTGSRTPIGTSLWLRGAVVRFDAGDHALIRNRVAQCPNDNRGAQHRELRNSQ